MLRRIDQLIDFPEVRAELSPCCSAAGRPSICPELMIRMRVAGYCFGIRPERRLCDEVHLNLAYRRFCRPGLKGAVPDHSTVSKNRHGRFRESDIFRKLFDQVLRLRLSAGLVGGEAFAVDGSILQADADRRKGPKGEDGLAADKTSRAIDEYLAVPDDAAFGAANEKTPKFLSETDPAARYTSAHDASRDVARDIAKTEAYVPSRRKRKKAEMLCAHLKRTLGMTELRLGGPNGARDAFHLAATAQNLRRRAKLGPVPA